MSGFECLNCDRIGDCTETSEEKARQRYYCVQWVGASPVTVSARNRILQNLGASGLCSILTTKPKRRK